MHWEQGADWETAAPGSAVFRSIGALLFAPLPTLAASPDIVLELAVRPLPSHPRVMLVRASSSGSLPAFAFVAPGFTRYVAGTPEDVYAVNMRVAPALGPDAPEASVRAYLRLFLEISRGNEGWRVVDQIDDLAWAGPPPDEPVDEVAAAVAPIAIAPPDQHGRRRCTATVQRVGALLRRELVLWPDGLVQSHGERDVLACPALATPPPFQPFAALLDSLPLIALDGDHAEAAHTLSGTIDREVASGDHIPLLDGPTAIPAPATDASPRRIGDAFRGIAEVLLQAAIRAGFRHPHNGHHDSAAAFAAYLQEYRPTIAIETPYRELREDFAQLIVEASGLRLDADWQSGERQRMSVGPQPSVVLLTEATFGNAGDGTELDSGLALSPIIRGPHIGLFVVERVNALPQGARDIIDLTLTVPRLTQDQFWAATEALFGPRHRSRGFRDWLRYVLPRDIARTAVATSNIRSYLDELERTVQRRLAQYTSRDAPALADLHGLGEARARMEELSADVGAALRGEIGWDQVDRGYLLVGPPGTGKTTLVRSLAKECGIRFVLASASRWQEGGSLGPHIQNIRRSFREARLYAPAILFIDEIDSIGSRGKIEAQNSQYQTVVINTVLEELQGFEGREGVVVIGATNNPDDVDPALRRPGRLDRIVQVPYPNIAALGQIYGYYLRLAQAEGFAVDTIDLNHLARMTFGRTGSHVELYVRGAMRRARRARRRTITAADLLNEITNRPPDGLEIVLSPESMRRVAVHEAGHALINLTGPDGGRSIAWVSIVPRADGSLGFVARAPEEMAFATRVQMEEEVRIILGGRAAEELVFERDGVSSGAGGPAQSDLAIASALVMRMLTQFGFSDSSGLLWLDWHGDGTPTAVTAEAIRNLPMGNDLLQEARRTLDRLYSDSLERLRANQAELARIEDLLIARQDISPQELQALVGPSPT